MVVWGGESKDLVEIDAGEEVRTNVAAGDDRVENEEEKDLQSLFQKLHQPQAAKHFEKSALTLSWRNWVVDGINFARKGDCYQMKRHTCVDRESSLTYFN